MATTTNKSASTVTTPSPQAPQITTTTSEKSGIHYSTLYLHTVPGTIKCVCLVRFSILIFPIRTARAADSWHLLYSFFSEIQIFVIIGFICIQCSQYSPMGIAQFFSTVAMISFWFTGILLVLYLFHVVYVFNKIPWMKIEFFFCLSAALLLMLTSSLVAARGVGLFTAAAVRSVFFLSLPFHCFFFSKSKSNSDFVLFHSFSDTSQCAPMAMTHSWNIDNTIPSRLWSIERLSLQSRN